MADTTNLTTARPAAGTGNVSGKTHIEDTVVEKVAGIAAREVNGVHSLGNGAARAIGAIRDAIGQRDHGQGVKVEVGEKQVAADVVIVAEYPVRAAAGRGRRPFVREPRPDPDRRHGRRRGQRDRPGRPHPG